VASEFTGRWTKARRFQIAWEMLPKIQPSRWITQRFDIQQAAQAYQLIDQYPEETLQVVLTYP
jgi:threonine dehydrogenase-like Zn-dependent dehydrogenase